MKDLGDLAAERGRGAVREALDNAPPMDDGPKQSTAKKATPPGAPYVPLEPLQTVAELGWLDPANRPPPLPRLLTVPDAKGAAAPFLPLGKVAMLAAPGGTGKTQALMQLAVSVATGRSWLDTFDVASPGPVLMVLGEEDAEEFHRRLWNAVEALGLRDDAGALAALAANLCPVPRYGKPVALTDREGKGTLFYEDLRERLRERAGVEWRLVILDPASRFMGPECETDNKAATDWIEAVERLTEAPGRPTVLFAHHTNKPANKGNTDQGAARGSSALTDGVRWQANLDRVFVKEELQRDRARLVLVKTNYGPSCESVELVRDVEHGGFLRRADDELVADEAAEESKDAKRLGQRVKAAEADLKTRNEHLAAAVRRHGELAGQLALESEGDRERTMAARDVEVCERAVRKAARELDVLQGRLTAATDGDKGKASKPNGTAPQREPPATRPLYGRDDD